MAGIGLHPPEAAERLPKWEGTIKRAFSGRKKRTPSKGSLKAKMFFV